MVQVPGVAGWREQAGWVGTAQGKLVHRQLAQQNSPGLVKLDYSSGILTRNPVGDHPGHGGSANTPGVVQVFEADGDAMQRPPVVALEDFRLSSLRLG
jgi:hypothetical protein